MKNEKNEPKKISKEELMKMANLSEDDLEKVVGGSAYDVCMDNCYATCKSQNKQCIRSWPSATDYNAWNQHCQEVLDGCRMGCIYGCPQVD